MKHTKQIFITVLSVLISVFLVAGVVYAVTTISSDIDTAGDTTLGGTLGVTGATTLDGDVTLGNAVIDNTIVKGRIATGTAAGTALDIDSTYEQGELVELRASVSDYTNIPARDWDALGGAGDKIFTTLYSRAEVGEDDTDNGAVGVIAYGVANAVGAERIEGLRSWAYVKGDATTTVDYAWGVRGEFTMDGGRTNTLTITEAAGVVSRITSGSNVSSYTNIHGFIGRFGDMDAGSRTYGSGLALIDGPEGGTSVLTTGINIDIATVTGIAIGDASTVGLTFSGTTPKAITTSGTVAEVMDVTATMSGTSDLEGIKLTVADTCTTALSNRGIYVNYTHGGDMTGGTVQGMASDLTLNSAVGYAYALSLYTASSGDPAVGWLSAIGIYMGDPGDNVTQLLAIDVGIDAGTLNPSGRYSFMRLVNHNDSSPPDSVFLVEGVVTNLLDLKDQKAPFSAGTLTESGGGDVECDAKIKVRIQTVDYWIPLYNN